MSENKEPAIKLFGRMIPLQPGGGYPPLMPPCGACRGEEKDVPTKEVTASESDNGSQDSPDSQEKIDPPKSMSNELSEMPSDDKEEAASTGKPAPEEQQDHLTNPKGKALKKPDKVLPCPRCNSMDTKFCYYNNYNVNQPRHFCKKCQRYWTAGGTMRNVPVGSGRRKSKSSNPHCQMMMARPPPHAVRTDAPDVISYPLNPNGTVLTFGSDTPVCDSMASTLNFAEKKMNSNRNGFRQMEETMASAPPRPPEDGNGQSGTSPTTSPNSNGLTTSSSGNEKAVQAAIADQCFSGSPLSYPWIPAPLCGPSFPIPFYPAAAYWSCTVAPGTWSTPLISPVANAPALPGCSQATGPSSPLGKHTREGDVLTKEEDDNQGRAGIWIPKILRIHDPEEAAKSSIWALVGGRSGKGHAVSGGGLFNSFQQNEDRENCARNTSNILHANPAALSRSLDFQDGS